MRKIIAVFSILTVVLISCSKHYDYPEQLKVADSLCYANPDSAVKYLKKLKPQTENMNSDAKWYYRLLCVKAADKTYSKPESNEEILKIVEHYENGGDKEMLPEAYYYAGNVHSELYNSTFAFDYYHKALNAMKDDNNYYLKNKVYSQLGYLYTEQDLEKESLKMHLKSYEYGRLSKDTTSQIYNLRDIGSHFRNINESDSALKYYNKALNLAEASGNTNMAADVHAVISTIYMSCDLYDLAKQHLSIAQKYDDPHDRESVIAISARLYDLTGQTDSAAMCYKEMLKVGTLKDKTNAYWRLARFYAQKNQFSQAFDYFLKCKNCLDSAQAAIVTENIIRQKNISDYKINSNKHDTSKVLKTETSERVFFIITFFIITVLGAVIVYKDRKLKNMKLSLDNSNKVEVAQREETHDGRIDATAVTDVPEKSVEEETTEIIVGEKEKTKEEKDMLLANSEIKQIIERKLNNPQKRPKLTDKEWELLDKTVNEICNNFNEKLFKLLKMSTEYLRICQLTRLGISSPNIRHILNLSKSGVYSAKVSMYEKAFHEKKPSTAWDELILSL